MINERLSSSNFAVLFQTLLMTYWSSTSPVTAFAGVRQTATHSLCYDIQIRPRIERHRSCHHFGSYLRAKDNGEEAEENIDYVLSNDRREGMADAFSALDSLTAEDFDDLRPLSSLTGGGTGTFADNHNLSAEESAKLFVGMQSELSTLGGGDGIYGDVLGDLEMDSPKTYMKSAREIDVTSLGVALDEAVDLLAAADASSGTSDSSVLNDADGIGTVLSNDVSKGSPQFTIADVTKEILTRDIKPSLSMEQFISSAIQQAVIDIEPPTEERASTLGVGRADEIIKTAGELLENEELRREIGKIFDEAGERLRLEVEAMKKEQEEVIQGASTKGLEYLETEKRRLSEAEESVTRLIQKVARETEQVQRAMEELERAKNQVSEQGGKGGIEETALELKKGGLIKQASLVGTLLFGSRAVTELILVVGSPYGDEHFVPAVVQAIVALACAAYFFLVK